MNAPFDLVVRGGTVIDGRGGEPYEADLAISGSRIARIGRVADRGRTEIDARGMIVTPGFVDPHSHYDGQVTWSNRLDPSSGHGVTTTMMGNCGVGFAPCAPKDRERLIKLMEGVEDIPGPVLVEGLPWNWVSFPDYMNALAVRRFDTDVAAQLPHAALRVHVMGERGADGEPATSADIALMSKLAQEAIAAGAFGFSTSRTLVHQTSDGRRTPSYNAAQDELTGIGQALRAAGAGHMQLVSDFSDADAEFALLREIVRSSGRPLVFSLNQVHHAPELWRHLLQLTDEANAQGLPIKAMVSGRPVGLLMGFNLSLNPFVLCPSYDELASLSPLERMAALRSPEIRRRLLTETANPRAIRHPVENACLSFDKMYPFGDPPDYAPRKDQSVAIQAERAGRTPAEYAYDMMLNQDGAGFLYMPVSNFANNTLDAPLEMMQHANTVLGLSDGGAHCGMICDASMTTHLLTYWTRDRPGEKLSLPKAIKSLTKDPATMIGLLDRGVLAVGYKADLNVIDYDRLHLQAPDICWDLPAGGRRLRQQAPGYAATVLSGIVVARDGVSTGAFPGRLIRGAQPGPQKP